MRGIASSNRRVYKGGSSGIGALTPAYANAIARACARYHADVLVSMGLDALPYLVGPHRAVRVWYAADEWVLHHLSQVRLRDRTTWRNLEQAFVKGIYQRAFAGSVDRMWVVTERDAGRAAGLPASQMSMSSPTVWIRTITVPGRYSSRQTRQSSGGDWISGRTSRPCSGSWARSGLRSAPGARRLPSASSASSPPRRSDSCHGRRASRCRETWRICATRSVVTWSPSLRWFPALGSRTSFWRPPRWHDPSCVRPGQRSA